MLPKSLHFHVSFFQRVPTYRKFLADLNTENFAKSVRLLEPKLLITETMKRGSDDELEGWTLFIHFLCCFLFAVGK